MANAGIFAAGELDRAPQVNELGRGLAQVGLQFDGKALQQGGGAVHAPAPRAT